MWQVGGGAVGAVVGMSIAIEGGGAVVWNAQQAAFPYVQGMSVIFLSWIISPIGELPASLTV
jgi:phosphate/sulfate permease